MMETPYGLVGKWRVSEHGIFCGDLRIGRFDFDTDPCPEFRQEIYEQMSVLLNTHVKNMEMFLGFNTEVTGPPKIVERDDQSLDVTYEFAYKSQSVPIECRDITAQEITGVQIGHEGHKLWVCIDGACVLRVRSPQIELEDMRDISDGVCDG